MLTDEDMVDTLSREQLLTEAEVRFSNTARITNFEEAEEYVEEEGNEEEKQKQR